MPLLLTDPWKKHAHFTKATTAISDDKVQKNSEMSHQPYQNKH